jgi:hypothetical protein
MPLTVTCGQFRAASLRSSRPVRGGSRRELSRTARHSASSGALPSPDRCARRPRQSHGGFVGGRGEHLVGNLAPGPGPLRPDSRSSHSSPAGVSLGVQTAAEVEEWLALEWSQVAARQRPPPSPAARPPGRTAARVSVSIVRVLAQGPVSSCSASSARPCSWRQRARPRSAPHPPAAAAEAVQSDRQPPTTCAPRSNLPTALLDGSGASSTTRSKSLRACSKCPSRSVSRRQLSADCVRFRSASDPGTRSRSGGRTGSCPARRLQNQFAVGAVPDAIEQIAAYGRGPRASAARPPAPGVSSQPVLGAAGDGELLGVAGFASGTRG